MSFPRLQWSVVDGPVDCGLQDFVLRTTPGSGFLSVFIKRLWLNPYRNMPIVSIFPCFTVSCPSPKEKKVRTTSGSRHYGVSLRHPIECRSQRLGIEADPIRRTRLRGASSDDVKAPLFRLESHSSHPTNLGIVASTQHRLPDVPTARHVLRRVEHPMGRRRRPYGWSRQSGGIDVSGSAAPFHDHGRHPQSSLAVRRTRASLLPVSRRLPCARTSASLPQLRRSLLSSLQQSALSDSSLQYRTRSESRSQGIPLRRGPASRFLRTRHRPRPHVDLSVPAA